MLDWQQFQTSNADTPEIVDPRRRLGICTMVFAAVLLLVFVRTVQLEIVYGDGFREEALRPIEKKTMLPAARGRILARDGTVLADNRTTQAVAVAYRSLQEPPDEQWLRQKVRARLPKRDRKNATKFAAEKEKTLAERKEFIERLARLCNVPPDQWKRRSKSIETRVERIADAANRTAKGDSPIFADTKIGTVPSWTASLRRLLLDAPPTPRIEVAEQRDYHVIADDVPPAVVAELKNHADRWPGVKIVEQTHRVYPQNTLAAHVLGHLGPAAAGPDLVGRMGVEREYDALLQGRPGESVTQTNHGGRVLQAYCSRPPVAGRDVTLTLDAVVQQTAEELLRSALERNAIRAANPPSGDSASDDAASGGAIVVMDVENGSILAAASAPAFNPNLFDQSNSGELAALLVDRTHPLFDRATRMAIPPGPMFQTLTAAALVESGTIDPQAVFSCQGYLHQPDRQRCEIFIREGRGHGDVVLADALAVNCNVYFLHFSEMLGPEPLLDMAARFGFGRPTGIDLPDEAAGTLPTPDGFRKTKHRAWQTADTQSLAIGQSTLTATPLQVLCMTAVVANGGRAVTPRVCMEAIEGEKGAKSAKGEKGKKGMEGEKGMGSEKGGKRIVRRETCETIAEGLRRTIEDPHGVGHATMYMETISTAGKLGTAESGGDRPGHAWFAGYAPADRPRVAFVIVLEHAGDAAAAVGPVAKRLSLRLEQLGLLSK